MKAVVIGGGIIGLCSAYYLNKSGWDVVILDKTDLSDSCSYGNLGMIVPSHFVPLAAPGMVTQGIKWMFDRRSPFYIKPSLSRGLISWGLKFLKSATEGNLQQSAGPLLHLNVYSSNLYHELAREPGLDFSLEQKGILMYFKTQKVAEEETHLAEKARAMGLDAELLSKNKLQVLEPGLQSDVLGAVHYRSDAHMYPNKLVAQLMEKLLQSGVAIKRNEGITRIVTENNSVKKLVTNKGEYNADLTVMAAGSWLPELARMANFTIPLMPGKGYSFTDYDPVQKLNYPAILCEARVAITPMNGYMRYGGTMEIAAVNNTINMNRVQGIVTSVSKYFPNLTLKLPEKKDIWYGFRPCSPDGLPYIGFSKKVKNLIIGGGHAMMGLSMGPATGKIIADLANGKIPEVDISSFNPDRFL